MGMKVLVERKVAILYSLSRNSLIKKTDTHPLKLAKSRNPLFIKSEFSYCPCKPLPINGQNLAFRKSLFLSYKNYLLFKC